MYSPPTPLLWGCNGSDDLWSSWIPGMPRDLWTLDVCCRFNIYDLYAIYALRALQQKEVNEFGDTLRI